jgi:hypothetical protein
MMATNGKTISCVPRLVGLPDQQSYESRIEHLLDYVLPAAQSAEDRLEIIRQALGVITCGIVQAVSDNELQQEVIFGHVDGKLAPLQKDLLRRLKLDEKCSSLLSIPEDHQSALGSSNMALSRWGTDKSRLDWRKAVFLVGREGPPLQNSMREFLTLDFPLVERLVAEFRLKEQRAGLP